MHVEGLHHDVSGKSPHETQVAELPEVLAHHIPASARPDITTAEMYKEFGKVAVPSLVAALLMYAAQTVTLSFVGHRLGYMQLAAYSVGVSVFNIMGISVGTGFASALETLAPQAYGRGDVEELGVLFQRSIVVCLGLLVPVGSFFLFSEPLLTQIYGPSLGHGASVFLSNSVVYIFLVWVAAALTRILAAQHLAHVSLYAYFIGTPVAWFFNDLLLQPDSNLATAVWVLCLAQAVVVTVLLVAARWHPKSLIWKAPYPSPALWDVDKLLCYIKLGSATAFGFCSEVWAFEVLQIVAAQMGEAQVAAFTLMLYILIFLFSFAAGISAGGGTMIGNALGANQPELARRYLHLTGRVALVSMTFTSGLIFFKGTEIVKLYTKDEEVINIIRPMQWVFALWQLGDALQSMQHGLFRGAGHAKRLAVILTSVLWLVGVPFAVIGGLALGFGVLGILGGQLISLAVLIPILLRDLTHWNWVVMAKEASKALAMETEELTIAYAAHHPAAASALFNTEAPRRYDQHAEEVPNQ